MKGKSKKKSASTKEELKDILLKKAMGYDSLEVVEEYSADDDGEVKLIKKKVVKKPIPPDVTALKLLMEGGAVSIAEMSDEQLNEEKVRLLNLLKEIADKGEK